MAIERFTAHATIPLGDIDPTPVLDALRALPGVKDAKMVGNALVTVAYDVRKTRFDDIQNTAVAGGAPSPAEGFLEKVRRNWRRLHDEVMRSDADLSPARCCGTARFPTSKPRLY